MNLPRSAAEALTDHVIFEIEGIDRMYLNVFVPRLQRAADVAAGYLMRHRGFPIASTALVAEMSRTFISGLLGYARAHQVPVLHFKKAPPDAGANATLTLTKPIFIKMMAGTAGVKDTLLSDDLKVDGSKIDLVRFFSLIDKAPGTFQIVTK